MKKLITILVTISFFSCLPEPTQYEDRYAENLLLQYLITPKDPQAACDELLVESDNCQEISANAFSTSFTRKTETERAVVCSGYFLSPIFSETTDISKTCIVNCQKRDWVEKRSAGVCETLTIPQLQEANLGSPSVLLCVSSCFSATNTELSSDQAPLFLLLNFLQNGD